VGAGVASVTSWATLALAFRGPISVIVASSCVAGPDGLHHAVMGRGWGSDPAVAGSGA
jgi:hypothetical protein